MTSVQQETRVDSQEEQILHAREAAIEGFVKIGLPIRIARSLAFWKIYSGEEVQKYTDKRLLEVKGIHKRSLAIIRSLLPFDASVEP